VAVRVAVSAPAHRRIGRPPPARGQLGQLGQLGQSRAYELLPALGHARPGYVIRRTQTYSGVIRQELVPARGHARLGCTSSCLARRPVDARVLAFRREPHRRAPACNEGGHQRCDQIQSQRAVACNEGGHQRCDQIQSQRAVGARRGAPACNEMAPRWHQSARRVHAEVTQRALS